MTKTLLYFDDSKFNSSLASLRIDQVNLQNLLNEVNRLQIFRIETPDELRKLVEQQEEYVREYLQSQLTDMSWGAFKFSKRKAIDMLEVPDLKNLKNLCNDCINISSYSYRYLDIVKHSEVVLYNLEGLKDSCSIFATTKEQKDFIDAHRELTKAFKSFSKAHTSVYGNDISESTELSKLFEFRKPILSKTPFTIPGRREEVTDNNLNSKTFGQRILNTIIPDMSGVEVKHSELEVEMKSYWYSLNRFPQ